MNEELPKEILEIYEIIDNSPELQKLLIEKFEFEDEYGIMPKLQQRSRPYTPRFGKRDSESVNLNSRPPFPPRFGKRNSNLPPYLPRLG
jgi:hypothetical protein